MAGSFTLSDLGQIQKSNTLNTDALSCQLDWIGGFRTAKCRLEIEVALTPEIRCLDIDNLAGNARTQSVRRTMNRLSQSIHLGAIGRLELGSHFWLTKQLKAANYSVDESTKAPRGGSYTSICTTFHDDSSDVSTFYDLRRKDPTIASFIERYATCPDATAFFISSDKERCVVIPTSEILRACYTPTGKYLENYLNAPERPPTFESDEVIFTGFGFRQSNVRKVYPFKRARYKARAEHEIQQLLPRATVYHRLSNGQLPVLIRPPFLGKVVIQGHAMTKRDVLREITVFISRVEFLAPLEHGTPKYVRNTLARIFANTQMPFAPVFAHDFACLPYLGVAYQGRTGLNRKYDVRRLKLEHGADSGTWEDDV